MAEAGRLALRGIRAVVGDLTSPAGSPLRRWPRDWLLVAPAVLAGAVLGAITGVTAAGAGVPGPTAAALGVAQALPLVVALTRPLAGFWLSLLVGMVASETIRAGGDGPVWAAPSLATHLGVLAVVALGARPRVLVELWLLTLLAGAILVQRMPGMDAAPDLAAMTSLSAIVLLTIGAVRGRGEARRRLAEQTRVSDAERARRTLLEERARIARELHDVVAHHLSVIAIQAEAAPYRVTDPPEELTRSFELIRGNAREGLDELRRVLGLLRGLGEEEERPGPQPSLAGLEDLVANGRSGGLAVTWSVDGERRQLPAGVELSAYRIVQEALSNAMRHAPGAEVSVRVGYRPDDLELRVVNGPPVRASARPPAPAGGGHGVMGMRERAAMLGGRLSAGPGRDGGWTVVAVLPVDAGDRSGA